MTDLLEIGTVARELGVAPSTLRTWERRYRVVVPRRGRQGQRLYDPDQVVTLRSVLSQVRRGTPARLAHDLAAGPLPLRTVRARLRPTPEAPKDARRAVDGLLRDSDDSRFSFLLRLVASELVGNAVRYGSEHSPISLTALLFCSRAPRVSRGTGLAEAQPPSPAFPDYAELQVTNAGDRLSLRRMRERRREGGRGLDIVDELADAWSIDSGPAGTRVTVRLSAGLTTGRARGVFRGDARMGRLTRPVR